MAEEELSTGVFEAKPTQYMPKIFGVDGRKMAPEDLKVRDILVVYWKEPAKYKTETSVVRFEKFVEQSVWSGKKSSFFCRAESEPLSVCYYPLEEISEIRFCARDSSASSQIFLKLHDLYKENRRLTEKLETIKKRIMDLAA